MTSIQNQALKALPNVLHDQTVPNTLAGVSVPRPAARPRLPQGVLVAAASVVLAALVALLARAA